jgi:hypothetical protein
VEQFENAYAGIEKLDFAPDDNSILDALAALRS